MSIRGLIPLWVALAILLAGCAGPTPTAVIAPTATNVPTVALAATATGLPAATPTNSSPKPSVAAPTAAAIATAEPHDLVPADQLNPKTQARLRLGYYVADGPNVDLIVNNAIAVNGNQPQINIPANYAPGYLYLPPGSYSVAVVPTGQGIAQALLPPVEVPVVAGHRYTLAILGLVGDKSLKPLLIDETAEALKAGALPTDSVRIWIDGMAGGTAIDVSGGGNTTDTQVAYGASTAVVYPVGNYPLVTKLIGADSAYPSYDDPSNAPGTTNMVAFVGAWGNQADAISGPPVSELSILDYLRGFSGKKVNVDGPASFDTLLAAIKTAGLEDLLTTGGPYWFLAPTDAAFQRLPDQLRAALLADPKALGDLLRNLLVAAYVPRGALAKTPGGAAVRTLTNLLGTTLTVGDGFSVNGVSVGGNSVFLADGSQVHPISQLLLPPSVVALAPPTPAATASATSAITATGRIAYYAGADHSPDNQLEIYLINADGSGKIQVTNNQFSDDFPVLSPDGKRIAFVSDRDGSDENYVMPAPATQAEAAAADQSAVRLTKNGANDKDVQWALSPQWSPDGKQLAFVSNHEGNPEIYVINADGTGQTRVTNDPATDTSPSWSPDGKHIAFDSDRGGNVDVYVMNADGSGVRDLANNPANDGQPVWSPDGQQIAFVSDRTGTGIQIFVMQADGSRQTNVSNSPGNDFAAIWSPDGADLAFFREADSGLYIMRSDGSHQTLLTRESVAAIPTSWGRGPGAVAPIKAASQIAYVVSADDTSPTAEIYIMNPDGSGQTRLTNNTFADSHPALSPDGKQIAFRSDRDGHNAIYVMNADGSGQTIVPNHATDDGGPIWSPDGKTFVFGSTRDGNSEIYVMNVDGSHVTRLTNNPASDLFPRFSPDGKQISFLSDRSGKNAIYVMQADGTGQKLLTDNAIIYGYAVWSPDGKKIVFGSDRDGNGEIYAMNADGSGVTRLTNDPGNDDLPVWSPDGKQIAFGSDRDGSEQVYVMNADGSGQTQLTHDPKGAWWPSWSAAAIAGVTTTQAVFSGRLAFASDRNGNDDIYLMTAGDSKVINLTNTPQGEANPRWSPDGKSIAFLSNRDGNIEIYVMHADGSGQTRLTNSPGEDVDPAWSPDGKQIAFSSHRDGDGEIYVMNADGSNPRRLTNNPAWDELPDWSPDGKKIAFTSDRDGPPQVYVMNVDGSGQTNLSQGSGTDAAPRWSPDGMHIAFWSDRDGNPEVYKMNADGSNQTRLTNNPATDFWPSWSIDGTEIFFDTDRDGNNEIYLMNADGSGQTNLTNNPASDSNWPDRLRK